MLSEYKPTQDPNIDTFKVQYLFAFSALLALLFPYKYSFSEVRCPSSFYSVQSFDRWLFFQTDFVGILDLVGICCYPPPALYASTNRRSRNNYNTLFICAWCLPCIIYPKLDISICYHWSLWSNRCNRWYNTNSIIFGLFLDLLYEVSKKLAYIL